MKFVFAFIAMLLASFPGYCQSMDEQPIEPGVIPFEIAKEIYYKKIGSSARLYNGALYSLRYPGTKGHQFYSFEYWVYGSISYLGLEYDSVQLKYDILNDKVIVGNYVELSRLVGLELNKDNIEWFRMGQRIFVHVKDSSGFNGIYDLAYSGKSKLLIKRKKIIGKTINTGETNKSFYQKDEVFVQSKNQYIKIAAPNSIFKVFPEHKKLIKKYRKSLSIKEYREKYWIEIIKYVDSLPN